MRNLLQFIYRNAHYFLFLFYLIWCLYFLYRDDSVQRSAYWNTSSTMIGSWYGFLNNCTSYIGLRSENEQLMERLAHNSAQLIALQEENEQLKTEVHRFAPPFAQRKDSSNRPSTICALVVNNSINRYHNYITINRGSNDGVTPDMGVADQNGVVGVVAKVSPHYSLVLSLLNPKLRLSCKVKGSDYFGSLVWDGHDPQYMQLEELPRHVEFQVGDTVLTSGYSSIFAEGLMVGTIESYAKQKNDNFFSLRVKLSSDFARLRRVILFRTKQIERKNLESVGVN